MERPKSEIGWIFGMFWFYRRNFRLLAFQFVTLLLSTFLILEIFFPNTLGRIFPDPISVILTIVFIGVSLGWVYDLTRQPEFVFSVVPAIKGREYASIDVKNLGPVVAENIDLDLRIRGSYIDKKTQTDNGSLIEFPVFSGIEMEPDEKINFPFARECFIMVSFNALTRDFDIYWSQPSISSHPGDPQSLRKFPDGQYTFALVLRYNYLGRREVKVKEYRLRRSDTNLPIIEEVKANA